MNNSASRTKELADFLSAYFCDETYMGAITGLKALFGVYKDFLCETKSKFDAVIDSNPTPKEIYEMISDEANIFVQDEAQAVDFFNRAYRDLFEN